VDLSGKVAFVTGASRGIGEAAAYELARAGANVVVMAKSTKDNPNRHFSGTIEEAVANIRDFGVDALAVEGDVALEADVERARDETLQRFGCCDILVNNAAVSYLAPFLELSVKRWDLVMAVNLRGPMLLCKAFLPGMAQRRSGSIINVSSADGRADVESTAATAAAVGSRGDEASFGESGVSLAASATAYGTSKAALNRFTVGLALEYADSGVAINALEVSAVTQAVRLNLPHADYSLNELPEAPGQLIAWLATQPGSLTGQIITQPDNLAKLRAEGIVRSKVDPS
jgi:NAD(P)-dependent dehydrogenase (short-subunit alcohol dehydrogenase family)